MTYRTYHNPLTGKYRVAFEGLGWDTVEFITEHGDRVEIILEFESRNLALSYAQNVGSSTIKDREEWNIVGARNGDD